MPARVARARPHHPRPNRTGGAPAPRRRRTGFAYYGYRYLDPVSGRWTSRDPIGERGGANIYAFANGDSINEADGVGLKSGKHPCTYYVVAGHGSPPQWGVPGAQLDPPVPLKKSQFYPDLICSGLSETFNVLSHYARCGHSGDRFGAVSCFSGDINKAFGERGIPGPQDKFLDGSMVAFIEGDSPLAQKSGKPVFFPNPYQAGFLPASELEEALKQKIRDAEKLAEANCGVAPGWCTSIRVLVSCRTDGMEYIGLDALNWLVQHQAAPLCRHDSTYECDTKRWTKGKIDDPNH